MARKGKSRESVSTTLRAFGGQVRYYRELSSLSQDRLGERIPCSGSHIGLIEAGRVRCSEEIAHQLDVELAADGSLGRLWKDLVQNAAYPTWFDWPSVESEAVVLQDWSLAVVPGLLQTRAYATAILHGNEDAVEARIARQAILDRESPSPPFYSVLMDESTLYRPTGSPEIMREQLESLTARVSDRLTIQIVPWAGSHLGNSGSFTVATMDDRAEIVYTDTAVRGMTFSEPEDLKSLTERLVELRSNALPVGQSVDLIRRTVEERWKSARQNGARLLAAQPTAGTASSSPLSQTK